MDDRADNIPSVAYSLAPRNRTVDQLTKGRVPDCSEARRVALLGTGYIADWHAKALASMRNIELVAAVDQIPSRLQDFGRKFGVPRTYKNLQHLLASEQLESVHVLLPPNLHFQAASAILSAGVNVFLEKPMCTRAQDAEMLWRLADERKLRLGVGHNFLFSEHYERLRNDLRAGVLGTIDHLIITWHRELSQIRSGPFDAWLFRDYRNVIFEIGSHCVAQMLDLLGAPDSIDAQASNPIDLPSGQRFYRRWHINALRGKTAITLLFSFVPGFSEYTIHVRGSLASATIDFERNTYSLRRHRPLSEDFDRYAMVIDNTRSVRQQARRTLQQYILSKAHLDSAGNAYAASITSALRAFYAKSYLPLDERISGQFGAKVVRVCDEIARVSASRAGSASVREPPASERHAVVTDATSSILVLGASGFIGRELVRQLIDAHRRVRVLVRNRGKFAAADFRSPLLECASGDLTDTGTVRNAMVGIDCVYHLARADVKSWVDYERYEIGVTRAIAEAALATSVKRLIYTGTIDSYYAGGRAGVITEDTPLDPAIERRNLYAKAKAESERVLLNMHHEQGLPVVIVRPGIVIGRGGSPMHWGVGRWWYGSVCQTWGKGLHPLPFVLVEDVARGLIAASEVAGIEGDSFNLVADPTLSAQEYLDEIDRFAGIRIRRYEASILKFYLTDMLKYAAKVLTGYPDRHLPSYRDWDSRQQRAIFDCTRAKSRLGWRPNSNRDQLIRKGIHEPLQEAMR